MQTPVPRGRQQPTGAVRKAIPAPRPLSPRAQRFVASVYRAEAERKAAFEKAFALGASVTKADQKTDGMVPVFDQAGNLVGIVDADDVTPIASAQSPEPKPEPAAQQAPAPPADGTAPAQQQTAKAMSYGAEARGYQQLGGRSARGGVPTVPAQDTEQELAKAFRNVTAAAPILKGRLQPGSNATAAERIEATDALNAASIVAFRAILARRSG